MLYEAGYNPIELFSATKGMNQNIAPALLPADYSYYIKNIMPISLGEGRVRNGTALSSEEPEDDIINAFPFESATGLKQQILYMNGYANFPIVSNLRIISSNHIRLTSVNHALFKPDTYLRLQYTDKHGLSPVSYYEIKAVEDLGDDTIDIEVDQNSFADALADFYIQTPGAPNPQYISGAQFSITVPADFITALFYTVGQSLELVINAAVVDLTIAAINDAVDGQITFTTTGDVIPAFTDVDTRVLRYASTTPSISAIANSYGYIKVLDVASNTLLPGADQTITGLSVACVPRTEFFGKVQWICNGVDPNMIWDGATLRIYKEEVKEKASSFNRIDDRHFSFVVDGSFIIGKYVVGENISLSVLVNNEYVNYSLEISAISQLSNVVTITVTEDLPAFTGANRLELFYFDKPPPFSYMKSAHDRIWCLGEGAVGLDYRVPDQAMRFYYPYTPYSDAAPFRFFNEKTKTVPSEEISAKHGIADNLEAILNISGKLIFMGRHQSQVWQGIDPLTQNSPQSFSWTSTLPVGIYHGDLVVELANDAQFLDQNGFLSFGTLNIAKQFAASNTPNMDKLASEYINSINTNIQYRACRSFKYNSGKFCGFKIGQNDLIVSKYDTSFFWWGIFDGDFSSSSTFLSTLNDSLYLYIGKKIYQYADGFGGSPIMYGDRNETRFIDFVETKYVNNIKRRYANKRYEIEADYSSSIVINPENSVSVYIAGDLRDTFRLEDLYSFPLRGDVLGTINLVDSSKAGNNPNNPSATALGMRLNSPSHTKKGRLKFLSNNFSVTIVGKIKNGPFSLKKIRLFGVSER